MVPALLALASGANCFAQDLVVRIGHAGPVSGAQASLGKDAENGARLAIDELNARGVTIGGRKATLELLAADDAADPRQAVAAARKLVDAKVSGVIGHLDSTTSIPASKIYSDAGIPQITPSTTIPWFTRQGYRTTFRVIADDSQAASALARHAIGKLKAKSFAIIDDRTDDGQAIADEFESAVKAAGGVVVGHEFTSDTATDFTPLLTPLKARNPDVVFFGGTDAVAGPLLRQMKKLGIASRFMGGSGICTVELPALASGTIADLQVVCAAPGGAGAAKPLDAFRSAYNTKFSVDARRDAPFAYDAVNVLVAAMVSAGSSDPASYLPVLGRTKGYQGLTGAITFDEKGDLREGAQTLYTYRYGRREPVGSVTAAPAAVGWGAAATTPAAPGAAATPGEPAKPAREIAPATPNIGTAATTPPNTCPEGTLMCKDGRCRRVCDR